MMCVTPSPRDSLYATVDPQLREKLQTGAQIIAQHTGSDSHDLLVVLGSGLAGSLESWGDPCSEFHLSDLPGVYAPIAEGHKNIVRSYIRDGVRVLVYLGRTHLYEGHGAASVVLPVQVAIAAGITTAVLTNAHGCLADWELGDVMTIVDHVNATGVSPFNDGRFVDISKLWNSELSAVLNNHTQRQGVYAIMRGPEYQTMAETRILKAAGVDAVGMSSIMEALVLHRAGVRVCGMSVVSDVSFSDEQTTAEAVVQAAKRGGATISRALDAVIQNYPVLLAQWEYAV